MYPSPPISSPHPIIPSQGSSVLSSPPSFIEDEDDSEEDAGNDREPGSPAFTVSSSGNESSQSTEARICDATQTRSTTSPRGDRHAPPKPKMSSQTQARIHSMGLDSPSLPAPYPVETNIPARLEPTSKHQQHLDSTGQPVSEPPLEHPGYLHLCNTSDRLAKIVSGPSNQNCLPAWPSGLITSLSEDFRANTSTHEEFLEVSGSGLV